MGMKIWGMGAVMLLAIFVAGCSSNSTPIAVVVTSSGTSPMSVRADSSVQFVATVTGSSTSTVYWQICKPTTNPPSTTIPPTDCTQGVGSVQCTIPTVQSPLTGFGTLNVSGVSGANVLYTAPPTPPQPNTTLIVATSCTNATEFGLFTVVVDSAIRVQVSPHAITIATGDSYSFTATVTGSSNSAVAWSICQTAGTPGTPPTNCGLPSLGTITASGQYTAPGTPQTTFVEAASPTDASEFGVSSVSVVQAVDPTVTNIDPTTAAQGSVQQDVFITGVNFLSNSRVLVGGVALPAANVTFLGTTLLRATIPAGQLTQAGPLAVTVQASNGDSAVPKNLNVVTVRPAVVGSSPESVSQNSVGANVILTGGFFSPNSATTATFNGLGPVQGVVTAYDSSRQLTVSVPAGNLTTPGLYPVVVQNSGIAADQPSISAVNLAVTPVPTSIPTAPTVAAIPVGSGPSAVAIDEPDGIAVVANTGGNSISLVNVVTHLPIGAAIPVGNQPTGVAVDDLLVNPVALVVNSTDQTVTAIDLTTKTATTLNVSITAGANPPLPFSVGVNPITHRAIVAYQSTNKATILNVSDTAGTPALGLVQQILISGTGFRPAVGIDPRLNWAVVTPGGAGTVNLVDLGVAVSTGEPQGRAPELVGSLGLSSGTQGVGVDSETHQALLSDPQNGTLTTFSLLDDSVTTVSSSGAPFNQTGFGAAAASSLERVGIAVSGTPSGSSAVVVDLNSGVVLQTVGSLGHSPTVQAVAVDPVSNQAVVVNQGDSTVSILSLGPAVDPLQIVEASPAIVFGGPATPPSTLTLTGAGFVGGSEVLLDGIAVPVNSVSANGRKIIATVPASMLAAPRRYIVQIENPGSIVSNVTDLTIIQPVTVGTSPVGVAVDTDRDLAVVTNSDDGTVSLVALTPATPTGSTATPAGAIGTIGGPITVGSTPEGVAVIPRLGLAINADNGSNSATQVDVTETNIPVQVGLCAFCTGPTGVAIDQDTATAAVTETNSVSSSASGDVDFFSLPATTSASPSFATVDPDPVAVAIDPELEVNSNPVPYAAIATDSPTSSVQFVNIIDDTTTGRVSGLQNPSGIVFDPVNQVFLAANSLLNEVVIIDPTTFIPTAIPVGIGPTSLDYNFQTSTLVTVNSISHTMSVIAYVCPPSAGAPACLGPQVQSVLGLGGTQNSTPVLGPNALSIDPKLNLAVVVDQDNNRVLLVPLPH
jgi:DNA-binding beta-propeller fold protein YncE